MQAKIYLGHHSDWTIVDLRTLPFLHLLYKREVDIDPQVK